MKCPFMRFFWYWLPAIVWPVAFRIAALFLVSGRPPTWAAHNDKLLHFLYFGIMAVLFWRALRFERRMEPWPAAMAAFAIIAVYGGLDEFTQQFRSGRSADVWDWFADLAGGSLLFLVAAVETQLGRRRPSAVPIPCPET